MEGQPPLVVTGLRVTVRPTFVQATLNSSQSSAQLTVQWTEHTFLCLTFGEEHLLAQVKERVLATEHLELPLEQNNTL